MNGLNVNNLNDRLYCFNENELLESQVFFYWQSVFKGVLLCFFWGIGDGVNKRRREGGTERRGVELSNC